MSYGWAERKPIPDQDRAARYRQILMSEKEMDPDTDTVSEPDPDDWYDRFREERDDV